VQRDVVGHAFGRRYRDLRSALVEIDFVERRAGDAAGEHAPGLVDPKPVHAVKRRARNKFCHLICLRRCADDGGEKHCRCDRRTSCEPARHDATSRCFLSGKYSSEARIWQTKLVGRRRLPQK